ncbi:MAG: hypothetical protein K1X94_35155 [Sandaracinaceae bacterium]|jgi:hypothetical protein|nr:hypothetical protein [Sandaracinaceae bacterium]
MIMQVVVALALVLVPVLVAALVSLAAGTARSAGVRVPRIMREGPWHVSRPE